MKKILSVLTIVTIVLGLGAMSFADDSIKIDVIGPCPIHGIHQMDIQTSSGIAHYNVNSDLNIWYNIANPLYYKCDCGHELFTEGRPHLHGKAYIGRFVFGDELFFGPRVGGAYAWLTYLTKPHDAENLSYWYGYEF